MTISGGDGDDIVRLAAGSLAAGVIQEPVTIQGDNGNDHLYVADGNLNSVTALVTFDGVDTANGSTDSVTLNDQSGTVGKTYSLSTISLTTAGFGGLKYKNIYVAGITLNCGSGDDTFIQGNGIVPPENVYGNDGNDNFVLFGGNVSQYFPVTENFVGGNGIDALTLDDSLDSNGNTWDITSSGVAPGGFGILVGTTDFESVALNTGSGADTINFATSIQENLSVDSGGGNDTIVVGSTSQAQFFGNVTINGGAGNDNIYWNRGSNNWYELIYGTVKYDVSIDGGSGYNTLSIDDTSRGNTSYQFYADRIYSFEPAAFPFGADIDYLSMSAIGLGCSNGTNSVVVYSTSADIAAGNQISIALNGGNDAVTLYPHDAQGNLTINGTLGIGGGPGSDTLTVDDTASALPVDYRFQNLFGAGTTNIAGMGTAGFGAGSDLESITINAGNGDDTFNVDTFKSGSALTIRAGGGNDVLDFGNNNLPLNITSLASFVFDGQDGFDRFNLNNATEISQWQYIRDTGTIRSDRGAPAFGYFVILQDANVEEMTVNAGPGVDSFYVRASAPGSSTVLNAGGGLDGLVLADSTQNLDGIQGLVRYNAGSDGGNILVSDNADASGDTAHLTDSTFGTLPAMISSGPAESWSSVIWSTSALPWHHPESRQRRQPFTLSHWRLPAYRSMQPILAPCRVTR